MDRVARLLDSPRSVLRKHISDRLVATHGAAGEPLTWLASQPIMERADIVDPAAELCLARRFRRLEEKRTSGSTGVPVRICKSMDMAAQIDATMWGLYRWHGIEPGMRHARFWGLSAGGLGRFTRRLADSLLQRRRLSAFEFLRSTVIREFHELRRFRPHYLHAYPSLVHQFASICSEERLDGRDLGIRVAFLTGELLRPDVRAQIESFFGARVVNEYGCSESGLLAFECERGTMHTAPSATYVEVNGANGPVTPHLGGILVTDLFGTHKPLLRYRLRDLVSIDDIDCECGRALPRATVSAGREDAFIITPSGDRLHDGFIARSMPPQVKRFRARQTHLDRIVVEVELRGGADPTTTIRDVAQGLETFLHKAIRVDVEVVLALEPDPNGKLRYFIPLVDGG